MSLESFRRALDELDEPTWIDGSLRVPERIAVMLPDGDVAAADDPGFVDWLLEHGEVAPFGHGRETRVDVQVRNAVRLRARGAATISGFDPALILDDIEAALSPRTHLIATLTDVLVYPTGGHFARHKDTPRTPELVGTLVVGLPIEHTGGAFHIDEIAGIRVFDWSGAVERDHVRWVAVFSDVDHEIKPVEGGARVTLVYSLSLSDRARADASLERRYAALRDAARRLAVDEHPDPLMIACTRQVISGDEPVQTIDSLRGADREIARALADAGFRVQVRTCLVARSAEYDAEGEPPRFRLDVEYEEVSFARLARPFTDADVAQLLEAAAFVRPWGDGGGFEDDEATDLSPYVIDQLTAWSWIIRKSAATTLLREIEFADDGYVGNAASLSYLYKLAALEVTRAPA